MGFRFRKSFGAGPFRLNLSKSGVGWSVGGRGYRFTKKAGGGTRTTFSIPGTGISHVSETGKKRTSKKADKGKNQNGGMGCGPLLLILCFLAFCLDVLFCELVYR